MLPQHRRLQLKLLEVEVLERAFHFHQRGQFVVQVHHLVQLRELCSENLFLIHLMTELLNHFHGHIYRQCLCVSAARSELRRVLLL